MAPRLYLNRDEENLGALERIAGLTYSRASLYEKAISHYKVALDFNSDDFESKISHKKM